MAAHPALLYSLIVPFLLEDTRAILHHVGGPGWKMTCTLSKTVVLEVNWYKTGHSPLGLCVLVMLEGWKEGCMSSKTWTLRNLMC